MYLSYCHFCKQNSLAPLQLSLKLFIVHRLSELEGVLEAIHPFSHPAEILLRVSLAITQSLLEYSVTELTVFPGNSFPSSCLYIWLVFNKCWLEEMILSNISSTDTCYLLQNNKEHIYLLFYSRVLEYSKQWLMPLWNLLISRAFCSFISNSSYDRTSSHDGEKLYCDYFSLLSSFFKDLALSGFSFLESRLCTNQC